MEEIIHRRRGLFVTLGSGNLDVGGEGVVWSFPCLELRKMGAKCGNEDRAEGDGHDSACEGDDTERLRDDMANRMV